MTFWCDDVFATSSQLKAKGVEFTAEPRKEVWERWRFSGDVDGQSVRALEPVIAPAMTEIR